MKKYLRFLASVLALAALLSAFGVFACADGLQSGKELFAETPYDEAGEESLYRQTMYRAYKFDENLLLPTEQNAFNTYDGKIRYVQGSYGYARGEKLYASPEDDAKPEWYVRDGCRVQVYGEKNGFCFVELLYYNKSEGTFAWIPSKYVVDKWSFPLSVTRTGENGGW